MTFLYILAAKQTVSILHGNAGRWDPKITTPPGLYALAVVYARLVTALKEAFLLVQGTATASSRVAGPFISQEQCAAAVLRQVNWVFALGTVVVMRALLSRRMVSKDSAMTVFCGVRDGVYKVIQQGKELEKLKTNDPLRLI